MSLRRSLLLVALLRATGVSAQTFEAGVQFSGMHLHKIDEAPLGIGGRFHYNVTPLVAADLEFIRYPENNAGNYGETALLAGIRAGKRFDRLGFFGKGRPGVIHFGGDYFSSRLDRKTHLVFDAGAMLEYYPTRYSFVRIDLSDTVIYFGSARLQNRPNPDALGTIHNFQPGFGVGFRF